MKKSKFDKSNRNTLKIRYIRIVKKFVFDNTYIRLIINILRRHSGGRFYNRLIINYLQINTKYKSL